MRNNAVLIELSDNVVVATVDIKAGETVRFGLDVQVKAETDVKRGHKIAVKPILEGCGVIKYGAVIGRASQPIEVGQWVHVHNVTDITALLCDKYQKMYRRRFYEQQH